MKKKRTKTDSNIIIITITGGGYIIIITITITGGGDGYNAIKRKSKFRICNLNQERCESRRSDATIRLIGQAAVYLFVNGNREV